MLAKVKWTLLLVGIGVVLPVAAMAVDLRPMVVGGIAGNMHLDQSLPFPCGNLTGDVPVAAGQLSLTPSGGLDVGGGNRLFILTQGVVTMVPFTVHVSCDFHDETDVYSALSVQIAQAVTFTASPAGPNAYSFSIPPEDVLLYEAGINNGTPENGDSHPRDPVTGTIDLGTGVVQMHVVMATQIHVDPFGDFGGTLTVDLTGTIALPDADGDGVPDSSDNCRLVPNPDQSPVPTPVITGPPDATLSSCLATAIGSASAVDVCDATPVTVTNNAPGFYPVGTTVVTWTGVDGRARSASRAQNVTVVDATPPVFTSVPASVTMNNCGPASLGLPTASDDCGGTPALTNNAPAIFPAGTTTVTWTATDASGNHAAATQAVTVNDAVPPSVSCVQVGEREHWFDRDDDDDLFQVSTRDACTAYPTVRIGSYVLTNGETIKISESRRPGIRFVGLVGRHHRTKHFLVGPGQAVITSTDAAGNVASAVCAERHEHRHDDRHD